MPTLRLGTRGSLLARTQSKWVAEELSRLHPGLEIEEVLIKTTGDKILDAPLAKIGGKGLFVKEIEEALLEEKIDFAVHSMKDLPAALASGLTVACIPRREDPRDALCTKGPKFAELPKGAKVGTTSLRRKSQLRRLRPDLVIEDLRGNVDTRLLRLDEGKFDAIVLAAAGLSRLSRLSRATEFFGENQMVPAVGQGALAIEARAGDKKILPFLEKLEDPATRMTTSAERAFLITLQGGCQVPLAAYAKLSGNEVSMTALVCDLSGEKLVRREEKAPASEAEKLGKKLAEEILSAGGREILQELYGTAGAEGAP